MLAFRERDDQDELEEGGPCRRLYRREVERLSGLDPGGVVEVPEPLAIGSMPNNVPRPQTSDGSPNERNYRPQEVGDEENEYVNGE